MRALAPFSWLSRWLDRRIDARIAARDARNADRVIDGFRRIREARTATAARLPDHLDLATFAVEAIRDASAPNSAGVTLRIEHGWTPASLHGLSLERVPFDLRLPRSDAFGAAPPVGEPFAEIVAAEGGSVVLATGTRLPDNCVSYGSRSRFEAATAVTLAIALLRAARISERAASTAQARTGGHSNQAPHGGPSARAVRGAP